MQKIGLAQKIGSARQRQMHREDVLGCNTFTALSKSVFIKYKYNSNTDVLHLYVYTNTNLIQVQIQIQIQCDDDDCGKVGHCIR